MKTRSTARALFYFILSVGCIWLLHPTPPSLSWVLFCILHFLDVLSCILYCFCHRAELFGETSRRIAGM
jgi:hypothetical protein